MTPTLRFIAGNARWLAGGFLLCFFSSFGQTFFISLSGAEIRERFALSHGEFGGLYMAATLGSALTLPFAGRLLDRYPAANVAAGTMAMLALGALLLANAPNLILLVLALYLLRLFGQGMMTQVALTATARWFATNRGRAVSLVSIGLQAGEGALPFLFVLAVAALGWPGAWTLAAAILALLALPAITALIRVERDPRSAFAGAPAAEGRQWTRGEVLRDPRFAALLLGVLAPPFIGTTIFFHQVYLTELRGWPLETFAAGFAVLSATTIVFALLAGWLIDRLSAVALLPLFLVPLGLACLVAAFVTAPAAIFLFMALIGVSNGFSSTLSGALWPEIYGTRHLGAIRSAVVAAMVLTTALGPGITGLLIDRGVSYDLQLAAMGAYAFAAALLMAAVARSLRRGG